MEGKLAYWPAFESKSTTHCRPCNMQAPGTNIVTAIARSEAPMAPTMLRSSWVRMQKRTEPSIGYRSRLLLTLSAIGRTMKPMSDALTPGAETEVTANWNHTGFTMCDACREHARHAHASIDQSQPTATATDAKVTHHHRRRHSSSSERDAGLGSLDHAQRVTAAASRASQPEQHPAAIRLQGLGLMPQLYTDPEAREGHHEPSTAAARDSLKPSFRDSIYSSGRGATPIESPLQSAYASVTVAASQTALYQQSASAASAVTSEAVAIAQAFQARLAALASVTASLLAKRESMHRQADRVNASATKVASNLAAIEAETLAYSNSVLQRLRAAAGIKQVCLTSKAARHFSSCCRLPCARIWTC
jgi:hypothetical protein